MPTSDSEGFESADEGGGTFEKKQRKRSNSSSCNSDHALETEAETKKAPAVTALKEKPKKQVAKADGWDDFNIEESEPVACIGVKLPSLSNPTRQDSKIQDGQITTLEPKGTGWEDFDDWGEHNVVDNITKSQPKPRDGKDMEEITERMAATATTPTSSGWGWGWGVDSLLNTATAGFTTITNQMSQGISTVLETGIGAPDPEELAKKTMKQQVDSSEDLEDSKELVDDRTSDKAPLVGNGDGAFGGLAPLGSLLKFVGSAGSKVLHGGLDTLEIIGRKAMDVLQEHDPNLRKKRELLGLEPSVPVLSQVLREAKEKAEEEDRIREEKQEAKEVHYENLFDDYGGLVHLEALELLSKRCHFRIEEILRDAPPDRKSDMKDTLLMVAQLCELPEENDEDEVCVNMLDEERRLETIARHKTMPPADVLLEKLQKATEDLAIKIQFQPLVNQYSELLKYFDNEENDFSPKTLQKRAVSSLAEATSLALEIYHKAAEMLLVVERRMVADESDALTQMTTLLSGHFADIANAYVAKLTEGDSFVLNEDVRAKVTHIYLVANDSASYVQNALLMMHTVLQVGAIA